MEMTGSCLDHQRSLKKYISILSLRNQKWLSPLVREYHYPMLSKAHLSIIFFKQVWFKLGLTLRNKKKNWKIFLIY